MELDKLSKTVKDFLGNVEINLPDNENNVPGQIALLPPGKSIEDLNGFLTACFDSVDIDLTVFPSELPLEEVHITALYFSTALGADPWQFLFSVRWQHEWELFPGILTVSDPELRVSLFGATFDSPFTANAELSGLVSILELPMILELRMPSAAFHASLVPGEEYKAETLLAHFGLGEADEGKDSSLGLNGLALTSLDILGNPRLRQLSISAQLGNLHLGPGILSTVISFSYLGRPDGSISGQLGGEYVILDKGSENPLFVLELAAEFSGPTKNWHFKTSAVSGNTEGTSITDLIAAFTEDTSSVPALLNDLKIKQLGLEYETASQRFDLSCDVVADHLFGTKAAVEMIVNVHLEKVGAGATGGYEKSFSGQLIFRTADGVSFEFDLLFDQSPGTAAPGTSETTFIAAYKGGPGTEVSVRDLVHLIDESIDVPLRVQLKDAFFIYDKKGDQSTSLLGLDMGAGVDLAALPLLGKILPKEATLNLDVQPLVAFGQQDDKQMFFSQGELAGLAAKVPGGGIKLPARDIKEKFGVGVTLSLGTEVTIHFDVPLKLKDKKDAASSGKDVAPATPPKGSTDQPTTDAKAPQGQLTAEGADPGKALTPPPEAAGVTPAAGGTSASGIQWIAVNKNFGPARFNRIGVQLQKPDAEKGTDLMLWAYLDAGLQLGPLLFSLYGLGMGTPLEQLDPSFTLQGIGFDYKSGPVEIGAAFLRNQIPEKDSVPAHDEYAGLATIKTSTISLAAVGAYADLPDYKSLFIFASLNSPLGGPAFFFVTGLAAGFGYNRAVRSPDITNVGTFPLVNLAVGGMGSDIPEEPGGRTDYIHDIMDQLRGSIVPAKGQYFVAAGIKFTSFKLIDSFALLIVQFGEYFQVDVLGLSTVIVPTPVAGGQAVTPIAVIQLAIKASFKPAEGLLSVEAQLTANSYILDKDCHLTGGFAFYSWFAGEHEGDFVLSVGGYHPDFKKPAHYPVVPRLGLNWQVTPELMIKGGVYFALLPHMVMAGGKLEASYQSGSKKAWFTLGADFLICWKPYYYDARAMVDIGVEYTYHLFGTHHISTHLHADVHVWGPDFAGHAHISLSVISFDVDFGAKTTPRLAPVDWKTFKQSFLPKDDTKYAHVAVGDGLVSTTTLKQTEVHLINPEAFRLNLDSVIPYDSLQLGKTTPPSSQYKARVERGKRRILPFVEENGAFKSPKGGDPMQTAAIGIAPMGLENVNSQLSLTVERGTFGADGSWKADGEKKDATSLFSFCPVIKRAPRALWGQEMQQDKNGPRYVEEALGGVEVLPANAPIAGKTKDIEKEKLKYSDSILGKSIVFDTHQSFRSSGLEGDMNLRDHFLNDNTGRSRQRMISALGYNYGGLGLSTSSRIIDSLVMAPQIGEFNTTD